ncbi:hypothetical protein BRD22_01160 [Halobacteriales archaeon SW_8_68_21]|nr:MAG: hypothetical protein BRD22_01160 [Halobacteriales archaeon SW_8_68_21]
MRCVTLTDRPDIPVSTALGERLCDPETERVRPIDSAPSFRLANETRGSASDGVGPPTRFSASAPPPVDRLGRSRKDFGRLRPII